MDQQTEGAVACSGGSLKEGSNFSCPTAGRALCGARTRKVRDDSHGRRSVEDAGYCSWLLV